MTSLFKKIRFLKQISIQIYEKILFFFFLKFCYQKTPFLYKIQLGI